MRVCGEPWGANTRPTADEDSCTILAPEGYNQDQGCQTLAPMGGAEAQGSAHVLDLTAERTHVLLLLFSGWVNRQQQDVIDYLKVENRGLLERLGAAAFAYLTTSDGAARFQASS